MNDTSINGNGRVQRSNGKSKPKTLSGATVFNPKLIVSQMVALQSLHYFMLCLFMQINHVLYGTSITIDRIFTSNYLNIWTKDGWVDNGVILLSSFTGAVLLAIIVEKAKKCLDFSVTLFAIHALACTLYGGIPSTWDWWIVNIAHMIIMILLGECLCSRKELRDIPLLSL